MAQLNITLDTDILKGLFSKDGKDDAFAKLLEQILNQVLLAQSADQIGAEPYERTDDRVAYRNGFRDRDLTTRIGNITLHVPRHRNGKFSTTMFQRYQRSEQALVLTMLEMVINGVSTRKIENITRELCGETFSKATVSELCKSLDPAVKEFSSRPLNNTFPFLVVDAMYIKVRDNHKIVSKSLLIAIGINSDGVREILGLHLSEAESENNWSDFFKSLIDRGLKAPDLITSDDHKGLVKAIRKNFQGSQWQRCQTHFSRNMLDKTPKSIQSQLKEDLRLIYEATDMESARTIKNQLHERYTDKAPKAMELLDEAFDDITTVLSFPIKYRKKLRTTNGIERLNQEVRRRERVIRIFPNDDSAIRLLGAFLMEHNEKWSTGRNYMDMAVYEIEKDKILNPNNIQVA